MSKKSHRPGKPAPVSAQYEEVGPRGGGTGREVTVPKGHTLPPPSKAGNEYRVADRTKNQSGRGRG